MVVTVSVGVGTLDQAIVGSRAYAYRGDGAHGEEELDEGLCVGVCVMGDRKTSYPYPPMPNHNQPTNLVGDGRQRAVPLAEIGLGVM